MFFQGAYGSTSYIGPVLTEYKVNMEHFCGSTTFNRHLRKDVIFIGC